MRKWLTILALMALVVAVALSMPYPTAAPAIEAAPPGATLIAQQPSSIPPTRVPPSPTPAPWRFPRGTLVAGENIGELTIAQARQRLEQALSPFRQPIQLLLKDQSFVLQPEELGLQLSVAELLTAAQEAAKLTAPGQALQIPLELDIDEQQLRQALSTLSSQVEQPAVLRLNPLDNTFVLSPGLLLDVDTTVRRVASRLRSPDQNRRVTLATQSQEQVDPPDAELVLQALEPTLEDFVGVEGIYVADLQGRELFTYHAHTIFSGASVMKIGIMLQSYLSLGQFSPKEELWLEQMMIDSDNDASNGLLESIALVERSKARDLLGVQVMNETLRKLGLQTTAMAAPYESVGDTVRLSEVVLPKLRGAEPHTDPDPFIQTTPADMGRLLLYIGQCAQGHGKLLESYPQLTAAECNAMLKLMQRNADVNKIAAGIPEGIPVAHKSGYIEDMRADVALVGEGDDALVMSIWVWSDSYREGKKIFIPYGLGDRTIAELAHTLYSAFRPVEFARALNKQRP